jgi:hypothetical protein
LLLETSENDVLDESQYGESIMVVTVFRLVEVRPSYTYIKLIIILVPRGSISSILLKTRVYIIIIT